MIEKPVHNRQYYTVYTSGRGSPLRFSQPDSLTFTCSFLIPALWLDSRYQRYMHVACEASLSFAYIQFWDDTVSAYAQR